MRVSGCQKGRPSRPSHIGLASAALGLVASAVLGALGFRIAVDQLDHCHRRAVAIAKARLEHAGVATGPAFVARRQGRKQLIDGFLVADAGDGEPTGMKVAALA
jgi:hypothetical protein